MKIFNSITLFKTIFAEKGYKLLDTFDDYDTFVDSLIESITELIEEENKECILKNQYGYEQAISINKKDGIHFYYIMEMITLDYNEIFNPNLTFFLDSKLIKKYKTKLKEKNIKIINDREIKTIINILIYYISERIYSLYRNSNRLYDKLYTENFIFTYNSGYKFIITKNEL